MKTHKATHLTHKPSSNLKIAKKYKTSLRGGVTDEAIQKVIKNRLPRSLRGLAMTSTLTKTSLRGGVTDEAIHKTNQNGLPRRAVPAFLAMTSDYFSYVF